MCGLSFFYALESKRLQTSEQVMLSFLLLQGSSRWERREQRAVLVRGTLPAHWRPDPPDSFPLIFNSEATLSFMLPLPLLMVTFYTSNTGFYCHDANCECSKECLSPCSLEQATHSHGSEQWVKLACLQ